MLLNELFSKYCDQLYPLCCVVWPDVVIFFERRGRLYLAYDVVFSDVVLENAVAGRTEFTMSCGPMPLFCKFQGRSYSVLNVVRPDGLGECRDWSYSVFIVVWLDVIICECSGPSFSVYDVV